MALPLIALKEPSTYGSIITSLIATIIIVVIIHYTTNLDTWNQVLISACVIIFGSALLFIPTRYAWCKIFKDKGCMITGLILRMKKSNQ